MPMNLVMKMQEGKTQQALVDSLKTILRLFLAMSRQLKYRSQSPIRQKCESLGQKRLTTKFFERMDNSLIPHKYLTIDNDDQNELHTSGNIYNA
mmetsp:Transcript_5053/g.5869  ORF Transcript_5053/g.5869 Transcript_5053/m.5869 type:complete len:94 (-) Transcript_5053:636-917(-)